MDKSCEGFKAVSFVKCSSTACQPTAHEDEEKWLPPDMEASTPMALRPATCSCLFVTRHVCFFNVFGNVRPGSGLKRGSQGLSGSLGLWTFLDL